MSLTNEKVSRSAPEPPTLVLVQGSFQIPLVYGTLERRLQDRGFPIIHPQFPSLDPSLVGTTLDTDTRPVQRVITQLVETEGKTVTVLAHSYGGLVGSNSIPEELTFSQRQAKGLKGGVVHLIFIAAFLLMVGQSVIGTFGESPNNAVKDGRFIIKNATHALYNDLPKEEAEIWASRLVTQSYNVQTTKLSRAAFEYIPSTYLICENDQAVPPHYQEMFASSGHSKVETLGTGHSPMLSHPEMLTKRIVDILSTIQD